MRLHPAEIAREIRTYSFFKGFPEDLLLQVCTMLEPKSFKAGDLLLREGQTNKDVFFLRSGHAEVLLAGEVVANLTQPGECIGEMSVVTQKPVSTTIRAVTDIEAFLLNTENFSFVPTKEQDHFLHLLYRVYAVILAERLAKTNEKARLFEIANRALAQAQQSLEEVADHSVLLIEPDKKQLAVSKIALASTGVQLQAASDIATAKSILEKEKFDVILADADAMSALQADAKLPDSTQLVLMISKGVQQNLEKIKKIPRASSIVTRDLEDRPYTIRLILTALAKLLSGNVFGLEKYLTWGVDVQEEVVKSSDQRGDTRQRMESYFRGLGIRSSFLGRLDLIAEEMLMNAIYDAPHGADGKPLFNHLPRTEKVVLDEKYWAKLRYASDGLSVAVSIEDPNGALTKDTILNYLEANYMGNNQDFNSSQGKGGAGRGLHQIISSSDLTIFNIQPRRRTEVISVLSLENKGEGDPAVQIFVVN